MIVMGVEIVDVQMDASWKQVLADEFTQPYFAEIKQKLLEEKQA